MPHLDHLAESAVRSGAVNTIVNRGGELYGHNTDFDGFCLLARHAGVDFAGARTVILGRGGAAKAVVMGIGGEGYSFSAFVSAYFVGTSVGMVLHLIIVPLILFALYRAKLLPDD